MTPGNTPFFEPPPARETKPSFDQLPEEIRRKIERRLEGEIVSGAVVYGSLSSSAGYVLTLDSGLRVFAKGSHPAEMSHGTLHIRREIRAYEYVPVLKDVAPRLYSWISDNDEDGWTLGLWEYIARDETTAPAGPRLAETIRLMARTHAAAVPSGVLPAARDHNYMGQFFSDAGKWHRIRSDAAIRGKFLSVFEDAVQAGAWLERNIDALVALQEAAAAASFREGLMHGDLRLDNILFGKARSYIVDWPNACTGPVVFDLVMLFSHLESAGWGKVEDHLTLYDAEAGTVFARENVQELAVMAGGMSGYFADQVYRAVPEKLPRLRWMQKSLLCAQLHWLSRLGRIESPPRFSGQKTI